MVQRGQVFELSSTRGDDRTLWAYRYRTGGRASSFPTTVARLPRPRRHLNADDAVDHELAAVEPQDRDRSLDEVAVRIEGDVAEDPVPDLCPANLVHHARARAVRAPDRVEQNLGGLRAVARCEFRSGIPAALCRKRLEKLLALRREAVVRDAVARDVHALCRIACKLA